MRYSCLLALIVALSLAISSEGFRLKRQTGGSKHIAEVNFQQWQEAEYTEGPSLAQVKSSDNVSDPSIQVAHGEYLSSAAWKSRRDFVVYVSAAGSCCTGTISGDMVLTAGHCVRGKNMSKMTVNTAYNSSIKVIKTYLHPSWDVALLRLESKQTTKRKMRLSMKPLSVGLTVRLAGFGKTENISCGKLHDTGYLRVSKCVTDKPHYACASSGSSSRTAACSGDSGAPWFKYHGVGKTFYVVGVNSYPTSSKCGDTTKTGGMIRLEKIESWVKSKTRRFYWHTHFNFDK
jgi:hypothetical protein